MSYGTQVSQVTAFQFKKGITTEKEIIEALGPPNGVSIISGYKFIIYSGMNSQVQPQSYVPYVGFLVARTNNSYTSVSYRIGSNGVLQDINYSSVGNSVGFNAASTKSP